MSDQVSEMAIRAAAAAPEMPVAVVALSQVTAFAVAEDRQTVGLQALDAQGLPVVVTLPIAQAEAAAGALRSAAGVAGASTDNLAVQALAGFQAAPAKEQFDGVILLLNPGRPDQQAFGVMLQNLPAIIRALHDAGSAQGGSRKRLILPT